MAIASSARASAQSYPDPDVIPPMLVERVEVLTDGGSASYGSDAMGGVINFTTKKSFDGIQAGIRQGIGDEYRSTDVNFLGGKAWDTGSVYVGYNFSYHNAVFGSAARFHQEHRLGDRTARQQGLQPR